MSANMRVGYFLQSYPVVSQTFVYNELAGVLDRGVEARILAWGAEPVGARHKVIERLTPIAEVMPGVARWRKLAGMARATLTNGARLRRARERAAASPEPLTPLALREAAALTRWVARHRIDRIHVHFAGHQAVVALGLHWLTGIPFTVMTHGWDVFYHSLKNLPELALHADTLLAGSEFNRDYLCQAHGVDPADMRVLYCGVDTNFFVPRAHAHNPTPVVIAVARLHPVKALHHLIEAMARLKALGVSATCRIIGEGDERARLEALIAQHDLADTVRLEGAMSQEMVLTALQQADIYALTSESEVLPVAIKEAMGCGLPVVATDVRGMTELVREGETGLLVPFGDVDALADRLAKLVEQSDARAEMGRAGRELVEARFSLSTQVDGLLAIWRGDAA